ncbi:NADH-quinone oxidoreductase subunit L [Niveibacterium sp.]|uniref:NADH-quinone oxidoreductase subunit L n=1 Tax=Niveibacterium sp. TaxID=2017444 RepID=UPI0035B42C96
MELLPQVFIFCLLSPLALMVLGIVLPLLPGVSRVRAWRGFLALSAAALLAAACALGLRGVANANPAASLLPWLAAPLLGGWLAVLVQLLGTLIGAFSFRYLQGEPGQQRYLAALAGVLAAVHLLLLADHWIVLIFAWAMVGMALQHLLCFYPNRPFAQLAAFKKRLADRLADVLLLSAAALAWGVVGSGSLSDLWAHLAREGASTALQLSAVCLVLAVVLRTALLPVHGWLIQVMEAPTPVSALLHAGVVNLGGYVLIRCSPLLEHAAAARWLLVAFGLGTAVLAGMVMLTRISIKVRLAWSTAAQMGFMVLECGLGLYTLAALHLIGHSLYKAHTFLSASAAVQDTRIQALYEMRSPAALSLALAPVLAAASVFAVLAVFHDNAWPWWWSVVLALAWAPLLWLPQGNGQTLRQTALHYLAGVSMVAGLTAVAMLAHELPLGTANRPDTAAGLVALLGMVCLHGWLVAVQRRPAALARSRRWSYAGLYLDESYTRLALRLWPTRWAPASHDAHRAAATAGAEA